MINDLFKKEVKIAAEKSFEERNKINLYERGVCCFSEKKDDILMWSHYADGHKGFCLEFITPKHNRDQEVIYNQERLSARFKEKYSNN